MKLTTKQLAQLIRREDDYTPCEHLVCRDGLTLSVQAGSGLYSSPRQANADDYSAVEVGYPSAVVPELLEYQECGSDDPTESVYPYVPAELVCAVIAAHGGLVGITRSDDRPDFQAKEAASEALAESLATYGELELN